MDDARFTPSSHSRRRRVRAHFNLRPDVPTVLFLGALSPEKRVGLTIDAVSKLEGVQLLVAGDGPLRRELEAVGASALGDRCRFVGVVAAEEALAAADVLLLPSLSEGMPAVVLEAAFSGVPSVVSDVGALHEMVQGGRTGELVPVEADAAGFAAATGSLLGVASAFGAAARQYCTGRYDLATVTDSWAALLDELTRA